MFMKYDTGSHQWIFRIMYIPHMSGIPGHDGHIPVIHINNLKIPRIQTFKIFSAQQRILDGAYGAGRFLGLLTCISEAKMNSESKDHSKWKVDDVCVPNQWINYQLFIAQIKRAYYLDVPNRYDQLNNSFPRIHVKKFGEFFFEWEDLLD